MAPALPRAADPMVRARYMQTFMSVVRTLPEADVEAILDQVSSETLTAIDAAGILAWLPVEVNVEITRAVARRLGVRRSNEFFMGMTRAALDSKLLRTLTQAILRVAGKNPAGYVKWIPKNFELMFRDCGSFELISTEARAATLRFSKVPRVLATDIFWMQSVGSSLHSMYVLAECRGSVVQQSSDPDSGTFVYRLSWNAD